jgi:APA family basic amino acid/polyamine antiporter
VTQLRRELGLLDATMINAGTMIGSAIFIVPAIVAGYVGRPTAILAVWAVGGVVSLFGALCVAELGAALPEAGGIYAYLREAYGPGWGFLYGWAAFLLINPASIAAIAVAFASYSGAFAPLGPAGVKAVAIASILVLTALNCLGLRPGATTQDALTLLKIAALAALIGVGLLAAGAQSGAAAAAAASGPGPVGPPAVGPLSPRLGLAMVAVLWAFDGWIEITYVGSEVKHPARVMPRSIILSTALVIALFLLANAAYLRVLSPEGMRASTLVASDAAGTLFGPIGAALVVTAILVSTFGANNGIVLTAARIPYAMASDGRFFSWAGRVHPRFHTPVAALLVQGGVAITLTATGSYEQLATYVVFASWVFYALSCGAVIRLRHSAPRLERPYRTWGYPVTPIVFIGFATWLVANTVLEAPRDAAIGAALVLSGVPAYAWFARKR